MWDANDFNVPVQEHTSWPWEEAGLAFYGNPLPGLRAQAAPAEGAAGCEVTFQANTGRLWSVRSDNRGAWNLGMMPGASPSIEQVVPARIGWRWSYCGGIV